MRLEAAAGETWDGDGDRVTPQLSAALVRDLRGELGVLEERRQAWPRVG